MSSLPGIEKYIVDPEYWTRFDIVKDCSVKDIKIGEYFYYSIYSSEKYPRLYVKIDDWVYYCLGRFQNKAVPYRTTFEHNRTVTLLKVKHTLSIVI